MPLIVILFVTGVNGDAFVCRVKVSDVKGSTESGRLEFLLVAAQAGRSPAATFVATLDHGYTRGLPQVPVGAVFSLEGTLMDRSTYFGEQYLFFDDYKEVYVSQVKTGALWPSQISGVEKLYLSPFTNFATIYWVVASRFDETYSLGSWLLTLARFLLIVAAVAAALVWRRRTGRWVPGLVWVVGGYVLVAVFLGIPGL